MDISLRLDLSRWSQARLAQRRHPVYITLKVDRAMGQAATHTDRDQMRLPVQPVNLREGVREGATSYRDDPGLHLISASGKSVDILAALDRLGTLEFQLQTPGVHEISSLMWCPHSFIEMK
ncbi:hypothetical protein BR93DRAFT_161947 [Coniochaeta sp. PMI_546]|nr:hypothetical protein BR93DRAFT_161947 [Coniochaeta sp. PMI_546]